VVRDKIDNHLKKTYIQLKTNIQKYPHSNKSAKIVDLNNQENHISRKDIIQLIGLKRRNNFSTIDRYYTPLVKDVKEEPEKD
jgi:hypothetical protein